MDSQISQLMRQEGNEETRIRDFEDQLRLGSKWKFNKPSGEEMDWKLQRKFTHLLSYYKEVNAGPYGGVDPLQNEKRETACMGRTGGRSTGLPSENERAMNESDV
jgi:hypothetical protein